MGEILEGLNPEQLQAVEHDQGPLLVLAGAGSGKTRVITRRIARLLGDGAPPGSILALTFTNKAAREMRERVAALHGGEPAGLFLGTFHAWGLRLLRRRSVDIGLEPGFALLDRADSMRLVQDCLAEAGADLERMPPRQALAILSRARNNLAPPGDGLLAAVGERYRARLRKLRAVDFDDLLVLPLELLRARPELGERERPGHVLVDEFQDTNPAQAALLELLWPAGGDVCVVGDEDQSIYAFRGATLANLVDLPRRHPEMRLLRLERNYRSTAPILAAASALVAHNRERLGKRLLPERPGGEPVRVVRAASAEAEAEAVAERAERLLERFGPREVAVLYRTNAQSRLIEEALHRRRVAYILVKGQRFYERREVKDLLAYLRLIAHPLDDLAFDRIVNVPPRGIGAVLADEVAREAAAGGEGKLAAAARIAAAGGVAGRRLRPFLDLVSGLGARAAKLSPAELLPLVVRESGYGAWLEREDSGAPAAERAENLAELERKAEAGAFGTGLEALRGFLDDVAVSSDPESAGKGAVSLMTLHNAKGLEFRAVIVTGLEEGLLPHRGPDAEEEGAAGDVEEERRLLYVGMTRAREVLVLTHAWARRTWGEERRASSPSRFLDELPREHVRFEGEAAAPPGAAAVRTGPAPRASRGPAPAPGPFPVGGWVRHPTYGEGMVLEREGSGEATKLLVRFASGMKKKLVARYAGLTELVRARPR